MKKIAFILGLITVMVSCKKESEAEQKIADMPAVKVEIKRFDQDFFNAGPQGLAQVKAQYPELFPPGNPDEVWLQKMKDPFMLKLKTEVDKKFPSVDNLEEDVASMVQHVKFYFPQMPTPQVITLVSDDNETKAIYTEQKVLIPLSLYLGKDNYLYEGLPKYQVQEFEPTQILPDLVTSFSYGKIAPPTDKSLLSLMVYYGKELYMKDLLIPDTPDYNKIGYTNEQLEWAKANEIEIWRYFVDKKLLYDGDSKLPPRFIYPAPFSKFYLELDNESPGRIGQWIGWQIVRSYAEHNKDVTLQQILAMDAKTLFDNSKYKPKK